MFSYLSPEQRVRSEHPLRPIRTMVSQSSVNRWNCYEALGGYAGLYGARSAAEWSSSARRQFRVTCFSYDDFRRPTLRTNPDINLM
jgi:hypothetical protein